MPLFRSMLRMARGLFMACAMIAALAAPARAQVTLNFWDMIWGPPEYAETARKIIDKFNAEHPDIQVKYRPIPWANYYQTFVTAVGAGTAPDISTGAANQVALLYAMGAIRPLDDVVAGLKASGEANDFAPGSMDKLFYDNHYIALPWGIDIRIWLYRKDLLAAAGVAPPQSWTELREAAKKLTGGGKYGLVGSGDVGGGHYFYTLMLNNGGGFFDAAGGLTMDTPRNREAATFISDLVRDGSVSPASAGYDSDGRRRAFLLGQAAFILDGPGLPDSAPASERDKFGVLPPLTGPHGDKGTVAWVNNLMIYNQTKYPEQAKTFLLWWSRNQLPLWTEGRIRQLPVRKSFVSAPVFQNDPTTRFIIENYVPVGKSTGTFAPGIFPNLSTLEGGGVAFTLIQELLQGKDVTATLARADTRLRAMMK